MAAILTETDVWQALESVKDPEIPVVSVVGMGIVRDVTVSGNRVMVKMTPTFSGCPALDVMRREIAACVRQLGATEVDVETVLYPPWTTDWLSEETRARLKAFGLAPPARHGGLIPITFYEQVSCPYCDSSNTVLKNSFGSTLCRTIYYCQACQQPFEQFKAL
jgi:ring-1,2-phenylacetyl-CoA epoxidase subunit PaaD